MEKETLLFFIKSTLENEKHLGNNLKKQCIDYVESLQQENQMLKEKFKATNKGLQKVVLKRKKWKHRYQLARCEIKELKEQVHKGLYNVCLPYATGYNKAIKDKETQQKEFINWLENGIEKVKNTEFFYESIQKAGLIAYNRCLQKYKKIIGDKR